MGVERWAFGKLGSRNSSEFVRAGADKNSLEPLLDLLDRRDDGVEIRPIAGVEFGME